MEYVDILLVVIVLELLTFCLCMNQLYTIYILSFIDVFVYCTGH